MRLRDLGGLIVIDFIDMEEQKNRREGGKPPARRCAKTAPACSSAPSAEFGLMEMSRRPQSLRSGLHSPARAAARGPHPRHGIVGAAICRIIQEES